MDFTEKWLATAAGFEVMAAARKLCAAGRVQAAAEEAGVFKGAVREGNRRLPVVLRVRGADEVENFCSCRMARTDGRICPHAAAVVLAWLGAAAAKSAGSGATSRKGTPVVPAASASAVATVRLEGSLEGLEAGIEEGPPSAVAELLRCGFVRSGGRLTLTGRDKVLAFLSADWPRLQRQNWTLHPGERLAAKMEGLVRLRPQATLRPAEAGWWNFHCDFGDAGGAPVLGWQQAQELAASGRKSVLLPDGRTGLLDPGVVDDIRETLRDLQPRSLTAGRWQVDGRGVEVLQRSVSDWTGEASELAAPPAVPLGELAGVVRPYQATGINWLAERGRRLGGGILADDMGLGKTLQVLAVLRHLGGTSLVVCPASLVFNWEEEARRFWPEVRVRRHTGPQRKVEAATFARHDLILTNYALLRLDVAALARFPWRAVVLDEAQHIKNPQAQNTKAAGQLRADCRFALTGTPLENSLTDLWSLADFVVPGILGSLADFREHTQTPLEKTGDPAVRTRLRRRLAPLMLRRTKAEVLTELPPKVEQVSHCELTESQARLYKNLLDGGWGEIEAMDRAADGRRRLAMFTLLLRLRQVCCDPRLLPGHQAGSEPSAKVELLRELISEAVDAGHRTLVFSQFASMLRLLEEELRVWGVGTCRLDGATVDREGEIRRFREEAGAGVFLISLKAGGTGLNLAMADHVIHFDPWWNPAVEDQASDRAHRLGQTRTVLVRKLVARGTVEERILKLQESKRQLAGDFLAEDGGPGSGTAGLSEGELEYLVRGGAAGLGS